MYNFNPLISFKSIFKFCRNFFKMPVIMSKMLTVLIKKIFCCIYAADAKDVDYEYAADAKNVDEPQAEVEALPEAPNTATAEEVEEVESPADEEEAAAVAAFGETAVEVAKEAADEAETVLDEAVSGVAEGTYKYIY